MNTALVILATLFSVALADLNPNICTTPGIVCASCSEVASCVSSDDGFAITHLEFCSTEESCLKDKCTTAVNPQCDYAHLEFICNGDGMFPDPLDCHKYHYCVPHEGEIVHYNATCEVGFGYNPTTTFCGNRLVNNVCSEVPVPVCEYVGDSGPLSNPSLYYICAEYSAVDATLYPLLFACPHGGIYDGYVCHQGDFPTTTETMTESQ